MRFLNRRGRDCYALLRARRRQRRLSFDGMRRLLDPWRNGDCRWPHRDLMGDCHVFLTELDNILVVNQAHMVLDISAKLIKDIYQFARIDAKVFAQLVNSNLIKNGEPLPQLDA